MKFRIEFQRPDEKSRVQYETVLWRVNDVVATELSLLGYRVGNIQPVQPLREVGDTAEIDADNGRVIFIEREK